MLQNVRNCNNSPISPGNFEKIRTFVQFSREEL